MIPFIIGGVALAATGYGVAKLLEDDCNCSKSIENSFDRYEKGIDDFFNDVNSKVDKAFEDDKKSDEKTEPFYVELDEQAYEPQEDESLGKYDLAKIEIYNTTFIELATALKEIENLPEDVHIPDRLKFAQTIYPFEIISDELNEDFNNHTQILQNVKKYIDSKLDDLDSIIISGNNFEEYSNEDKELVQKLISIFKLIDHAIFTKTTNDGVSIAREVKRSFAKVEMVID